MPSTTPDGTVIFTHGFWQQLMEGGPLYLLFHFLFLVSVLLALVVVWRRPALPWMLLASCAPFIWDAAASHVGLISHLIVLDSTDPLPTRIAPFIYAMRLFNWGCVIAVAFIALSLLLRQKHEKSVDTNA